jgi:peptidoglycan/xylan/chitin deacetylase (PgdA/CDA1 family)
MPNGKFVISLDFEKYWGLQDAVSLEDYKDNLLGVKKVIPLLLELFGKYQINATFATVGFLFFKDKNELLQGLPIKKPAYHNERFSPYISQFNSIGENETDDPFHFGFDLVQQIRNAGQEIGSHTFSHYYCLERGQTKEEFIEDILAAKKIAERNGIQLKSLVFPRNQYTKEYVNICREMGFTSFRGNEKSWLFSSENFGADIILRRPFRLLDSYWNLSGHNCYSLQEISRTFPFNIPSSRFLRPAAKKFNRLEKLRLIRITASMSYAAKKGMVYHLWWHPHNFGTNIKNNFTFLEKILSHFKKLNEEWNFESVSMGQLSKALSNE